QEILQGHLLFLLREPEAGRLLIPHGHPLAECLQVLSLRTVLAVIVSLPDIIHIQAVCSGALYIYICICPILFFRYIQSSPQPIQSLIQPRPVISHHPALPEECRPALAAVSQDDDRARIAAGEVLADMLSDSVPGFHVAPE